MAFDKFKFRATVEVGIHTEFAYRDATVDTLLTISGAGFIEGADRLGAKLNDPVYVEGTDGVANMRISAIDANGNATLVDI